jgi:maltooligosyltrehalose trehalohydrolase
LHRDLLRLRREHVVSTGQGASTCDGAVLSAHAFLLRWTSGAGEVLLVVNLGPDLRLDPAPEPLLAPPARARWHTLWSSEDPGYGGLGTPLPDTDDAGWRIPADCAVLLGPEERMEASE